MSNYHRSIKYLYLGNQSEEQQKWGERLAYLLEAHTRLTQCMKMAKVLPGVAIVYVLSGYAKLLTGVAVFTVLSE